MSSSMTHERIVTACRTFRIILTGMCSQRCGHCPYPVQFLDPIPSARKLRRILRDAVQRKAVGIHISCGQGIASHPAVVDVCRHYGMDSFQDYLEMVARCIEQMAVGQPFPMMPYWDLGPLSLAEMGRLRPILLSLNLSLESIDHALRGQLAFRESPAKSPRWQIMIIENAGRARIPVTANAMAGLGEAPGSAAATLQKLADLHQKYGHLQAVCIRGFKPYPQTLMAECAPVSKEALVSAVAEARRILQPEVSIQVQAADFPEWTLDLIEAGADDIGDIPLQGSAEQYAAIIQWEKDLGVKLARQGIALNYRLPLFPASIVKGLYPTSLESRIDHALTSLRNGASPKHPAPLQKSSPIPVLERRIPPHKAALRLRKAAAAMTASPSAVHKAPFAQGHPAPRVAPGKKAAHAPHPAKSSAHAQHPKTNASAPPPRPLASAEKTILPKDPPTQRLK